jgi:glycogen(starch) synthase
MRTIVMKECEPRRILMTGDTVGGVWNFAIELADELALNGVEVCLATFGGRATQAQRNEAAGVPGLQLLDRDLKLEWMEQPWQDVEEGGRWLLDLEREFQPDIVHLNTYGHGALPWRSPVVLTAHSCVASWWAAVRGGSLPGEWDRYWCEVRCALQLADLVTAPSRAMLNALRESYGLPLEAARAIPNGRRPSRFRTEAKQPFVLAAGRLWDEAKNVESLGKVAPRLPWPVYLAGEQQSPAGTSAPQQGCSLLGRLSSEYLAYWYARASIFASPARYEPFGLSALEAALSGCALVLGDIPSLREVWGDSALFVQPDDEDALETALLELIENPAKLTYFACRSRQRAQEYTAARMSQDYVSAYRSAIARRNVCVS